MYKHVQVDQKSMEMWLVILSYDKIRISVDRYQIKLKKRMKMVQ